jgi:mono/diheme cytochrome c family protein
MSRPIRVLSISIAAAVIAAFATACGTQRISVPQSDPTHRGAVLFSQRCSGCHTLSYAATNGSATNVRTAFPTNGPNFNIRCERPVTRVLYAIENGGFSGAVMPQNVVVGRDATEVAQFVAKYAGRQAPKITGLTPCTSQPIGTLPAPGQTATTAATPAPPATAALGLGSTSPGHTAKQKAKPKSKPKSKAKRKPAAH